VSIYRKSLLILALSSLLATSTGQALAATIANTNCKSVGLSKQSVGKTYVCTKNKSKLIWVLKKSVSAAKPVVSPPEPVPTTKPDFSIILDASTLKASVPKNYKTSENVSRAIARLYVDGFEIPIANWDFAKFTERKDVLFSLDLTNFWVGKTANKSQIMVSVEWLNKAGAGPKGLDQITLTNPNPIIAPTPTAPTPTPTVTPILCGDTTIKSVAFKSVADSVACLPPTPTPTPTPTPQKPKGCYIDYTLPISASRFSIQSMTYSLDEAGYPMIDAVIKNDYSEYNGIAFTLVLFRFGIATTNGLFLGKFNYGDAPTWLLGTNQTIRFKSDKLTSCENDKFVVFTASR